MNDAEVSAAVGVAIEQLTTEARLFRERPEISQLDQQQQWVAFVIYELAVLRVAKQDKSP